MLTPSGQSAKKIEKVMLLALWANALRDEWAMLEADKSKKLIFAGIGKPSYPINNHTIKSYLTYWEKLANLTQAWRENPAQIEDSVAIDYGDPRGDYSPRVLMAEIMTSWYKTEVKPDEVLFTVGGIGALRAIFETFNSHYDEIPGYRIITPFPHYSAYSNNPMHCLHPINVMKEPGYKLTAKALEESIKEAYFLAENDHGWPKALLICNPSNPLGNIIDESELSKIAEILRKYPELHIIFDEAYTEMSFVKIPSFLEIAPDLKSRTIILRSATKALSAAGERMAVLLVFDQKLMNEILNKNISYFIHAPRSAQVAYAQTMANFDEKELRELCAYYKKKVDYVMNRLEGMGASMPDPSYKVEATFYALANFSDLFGLELPEEVNRALQKKGKVCTDEDLAYYLLFKEGVMIAPLSYFGLDKNSGYMRITCSGSENELKELMDRLEACLLTARKKQKKELLENIIRKLAILKREDLEMYQAICKKMIGFESIKNCCLSLKKDNIALHKLYETIDSSTVGF